MLPIINILLIVGILLFILYNLYVDTRNWSNTGSFLEGMENASSLAEYMGAFGGPVENYSFSSAEEAKGRCEEEGLQLCKKEEVIAGAKSKASLENVCSSGWTTDAPRGWYSVKGRYQCGTDNNWNTWAPPTGKGSAHCCKPATVSDLGGYTKHSQRWCGTYHNGKRMGYQYHSSIKSVDDCKSECDKDNACQAIDYNPSNNRCYTYTGEANDDHNGRCTAETAYTSTTKGKLMNGGNWVNNYDLYIKTNKQEPAYPRWQVINNKSIQFQGSNRGTNDKDLKGKSVDEALNQLYPLNSGFKRENIWAIERNEQQKWTIFRTRLANGQIPQHTKVDSPGWAIHINPDEPAPVTASAPVQAVAQTGAGSAEDAMENQVRSRAGNVAPMGSNVPQNCKKGCVAPTGPSGNCKVIQKDGVEKRECDYGCPAPSFVRGDTVNCKYDRDCNSCGTVLFNPDDPPNMPASGRPVDGVKTNSWVGSRIDVPGIQNAPGLHPQGQMGQTNGSSMGQMGETNGSSMGEMGQINNGSMGQMGGMSSGSSNVATVATASNTLFNENIMKQVLEKKDLIPNDINKNNEETSFNLRIGKKFIVDTASIRNFAIPNIDNQDYIELGRIVKNIKMREKDPQESEQVKVLYSKLNSFVLELLTDSSLDMSGYDNNGVPTQLNNKTRTTGMFGENSNSLITDTDTDKVKENVKRHKVQPFNSIWSLYQ